MERNTKIIATVGPACKNPEVFEQLFEAGVDIFRLNFSHGDLVEKKQWINTIRNCTRKHLSKSIAILADLQGPKIRTGKVTPGGVVLEKGKRLLLTTEPGIGTAEKISVTYAKLPQDVESGSHLFLDDGCLELLVIETGGHEILCEVIVGGLLQDNKGINLPDTAISTPSLTAKDFSDLEFCLNHEVDFVALSFVRKAQDIVDLKDFLRKNGSDLQVIAKIERPEAVENFEEILHVADGIMVARGDLGVEMGPERVPIIQKQIIRACNRVGKPVITATQMLESMVNAAWPTRAETSDIANAILDGSDALMLSGETSKGSYPVAAVEVMHRVAIDVEKNAINHKSLGHSGDNEKYRKLPDVIAEAACSVADELNARAILAFTQTGKTATLVAKYRPTIPIIAVTPDAMVQRRMAIYRGVFSLLVEISGNTESQIEDVGKAVQDAGLLARGDIVVITMGSPISTPGTTNLLKAHRLGVGDFYEVY